MLPVVPFAFLVEIFARLAFMNCSFCGEVCRCHLEPPPTALPRWRTDAEDASAPEQPLVSAQDLVLQTETKPDETQLGGRKADVVWPVDGETAANTAAEETATPESSAPLGDDAPAWRDELSARLNRYRARRRVRPPRYPSLNLQFDAVDTSALAAAPAGEVALPKFESVSNHALALDGMMPGPATADPPPQSRPETAPELTPQPARYTVPHLGAKIIEFPRFAWGPPAPPPDQLAEPVSDRPRILEVPEVAPPPPALGGITIEPAQREELEKRPGIDVPLQSAPLGQRLLAVLVDGIIIAAAAALFGLIFWKVAAVRPPRMQLLGLATGIPCLFWAAYQFLLIVYSGSTPGLRIAGLELARFDGSSTARSLRRWRVLASWLSGVSLGMGYAWVLLDEDGLCWHDRITHTYLAPKRPAMPGHNPAE